MNCTHGGIGRHDSECSHSDDAGIRCSSGRSFLAFILVSSQAEAHAESKEPAVICLELHKYLVEKFLEIQKLFVT